MRQDWTLRRQADASVLKAERLEACVGDILFLDGQQLTRDCISRELARCLPEFNVIQRATAWDVSAEDPELAKIVLVILYVHADHLNLHPGREDLDRNGIAAQLSGLEQVAPEIPRILMSEVEVPEDILEAFRRRVRGYVPTTLPIEQVVEAIRFVAVGGTFIPPSILSMHGRASAIHEEPVEAPAFADLINFSPRQNEVLRMLWNGSSNKVIAYELKMSESTVKVHIRHIMKKLKVNNRTQVVLRTRPERLDKGFASSRLPLPSALQTTKAAVSVAESKPVPGQASARPLDLPSAPGMQDSWASRLSG